VLVRHDISARSALQGSPSDDGTGPAMGAMRLADRFGPYRLRDHPCPILRKSEGGAAGCIAYV